MVSAIRANSTSGGQPSIHVNLVSHESPMRDALQRAAAFVGYAVNATKGMPLKSVLLESPIELSVGIPNPIPPAQQSFYQQQFRNWAIGQALIELDQSYQRFVASSLETIADLEHFKAHRTLCIAHKPNLANSWTVHEQFHSRSGHTDQSQVNEARYLRSLGNARNCLAHDSGLVTQRRLTDGETMPVRWPGQDMYQTSHSGERQLISRDRCFTVREQDVGKTLSVEEVVRERIYRAGDTLLFSSTDLSEIIFYYQILAMRVGAELHRLVEEAGRGLNT